MGTLCQIIIGVVFLFVFLFLKTKFIKPLIKIPVCSLILSIAIMLIVNALFNISIKYLKIDLDSYLKYEDTISIFLSVFISIMIAYLQYKIEISLRTKNDHSYFDGFRKVFFQSECFGLYKYSNYNNRSYDSSSWFALVIKFQNQDGVPFFQNSEGGIQYTVGNKEGNSSKSPMPKLLKIYTYDEIVLPLDNSDNICDFFLRGLYPNNQNYSNSDIGSDKSNTIKIDFLFNKCPGIETEKYYSVKYTLFISILNGYNEDRVLPLNITSVSISIK